VKAVFDKSRGLGDAKKPNNSIAIMQKKKFIKRCDKSVSK
jgi:hypothetical protein